MPDPVFDTSVLMDHLNGRTEPASLLASFRKRGSLATHVVVAAELFAGAVDKRDRRVIEQLLSSFEVLYPVEHDLRHSLTLLSRYGPSHGVEWHDCVIAATCLRLERAVVTLNDRHFRAVRGLAVERPY